MASECAQEDPRFLEAVLRDALRDPSLVVDRTRAEVATAVGENFLSVVSRVSVSGSFRDERQLLRAFRQSLIVKRQLKDEARREALQSGRAFDNEVRAYQVVLPLLQRVSPGRALPFPRCLFGGRDQSQLELIVLEDLRVSGFAPTDRLQPLDRSRCLSVLRRFAHFHATSMVLRVVDGPRFRRATDALDDYAFHAPPGHSGGVIGAALEHMVQLCLASLRRSNGDGLLSGCIEFCERHFVRFGLYEVARRAVAGPRDEALLAICHGDTWFNNLMFRGDEVMFLDLQAMRLSSPVTDLLHFLYSSTDSALRSECYDEFLEQYQAALSDSVDALARPHLQQAQVARHVEQLKANFSLEALKQQMRRHSLYGLAQFVLLLPIFTFDDEQLMNADSAEIPEAFHRRLRETFLEFEANGFLREEHLQ